MQSSLKRKVSGSINMKNHLDQRQGSYSSPLSFFLQYSPKKCGTEQKTIIFFSHLLGLAFFNLYEILLCKFCLRSLKNIEISFHIEGPQGETFLVIKCLPKSHFMFFVGFFYELLILKQVEKKPYI